MGPKKSSKIPRNKIKSKSQKPKNLTKWKLLVYANKPEKVSGLTATEKVAKKGGKRAQN